MDENKSPREIGEEFGRKIQKIMNEPRPPNFRLMFVLVFTHWMCIFFGMFAHILLK